MGNTPTKERGGRRSSAARQQTSRRDSTATQSGPRTQPSRAVSQMIPDEFSSLDQVTAGGTLGEACEGCVVRISTSDVSFWGLVCVAAALRRNGLESCNLIVGIDCAYEEAQDRSPSLTVQCIAAPHPHTHPFSALTWVYECERSHQVERVERQAHVRRSMPAQH
ncbi:hypothetical protein PybrP1_003540 [[Pythium] brassicae (nom. inval.)]|nr:hypothetical protein PybrP1_003540 [[Pythium] brassicae (nom. inval.)]